MKNIGRTIHGLIHGTALAAVVAVSVATVLSASHDGQAARTFGGQHSTQHENSGRPDDGSAASAAEDAAEDEDRVVVARRGDTFLKLMRGAGVTPEDANAAITAMQEVYDPRGLRPGQKVTLSFRPAETGANEFLGLRFEPSVERAIQVERSGEEFDAEAIERDLQRRSVRLGGAIDDNLYNAAIAAGLSAPSLAELIRLFSWDVDFQRDIQPGDRFDVMIERLQRADGRVARYGHILYAELTLSGVPYRLYRYDDEKFGADYYDDKGQTARKALLRTPIDGARLSSGYGARRHPILGYTRMHRGIDFAAPAGTPIYAAGHGTVEMAGRNSGYGNYVRIRHTSSYATAYAHMSRIARGIRGGARVKQGQIIGYVGTTGQSTGPHLHYEVLAEGGQVNPLTVKLPSGRKLEGRDLVAFRAVQGQIRTRLAGIAPETRVSQR